MNISVRVYAALLPRREKYLTSIWREKPFLKFYRLQKLKRVLLNTITAIFTASSAFPQKSSFLILRHCMHGKNNSRATQQRIVLGCVAISYRQRKTYQRTWGGIRGEIPSNVKNAVFAGVQCKNRSLQGLARIAARAKNESSESEFSA